MKHLVFLMLFAICSIWSSKAQESTTDYIYSSDGFEVKKVVLPSGFVDRDGRTYKHPYNVCYGLYSKDGKILVSALRVYNFYFVLDGCETICSKAFQNLNNCKIVIPSSVKSIAPDAICTGGSDGTGGDAWRTNRFYDIVDGCVEEK